MARRAAYPTVVLSLGKPKDSAAKVCRDLEADIREIDDPMIDVNIEIPNWQHEHSTHTSINQDTNPTESRISVAAHRTVQHLKSMLREDRDRLLGFRIIGVADATDNAHEWSTVLRRAEEIRQAVINEFPPSTQRHRIQCFLVAMTPDAESTNTAWSTEVQKLKTEFGGIYFTVRHGPRDLSTHQLRAQCFKVLRLLISEPFRDSMHPGGLLPRAGELHRWETWELIDGFEERRKTIQYRLAREQARHLRNAAIPPDKNPFDTKPVHEFCKTWAERRFPQWKKGEPGYATYGDYSRFRDTIRKKFEAIGSKVADDYAENAELNRDSWSSSAYQRLAEDVKKLARPGSIPVAAEVWDSPKNPSIAALDLNPPDQSEVLQLKRFHPAEVGGGVTEVRTAAEEYLTSLQQNRAEFGEKHDQMDFNYPRASRPKDAEQSFESLRQAVRKREAMKPMKGAPGRTVLLMAALVGLVIAFPLADFFAQWTLPTRPVVVSLGTLLEMGLWALESFLYLLLTQPGIFLTGPIVVGAALSAMIHRMVAKAEAEANGFKSTITDVFIDAVQEIPAASDSTSMVKRGSIQTMMNSIRRKFEDSIRERVFHVVNLHERNLKLYIQRLKAVERALKWLEQEGLHVGLTDEESAEAASGSRGGFKTVTMKFSRPKGAKSDSWTILRSGLQYDDPIQSQLVAPQSEEQDLIEHPFKAEPWPPDVNILDLRAVNRYLLHPDRFLDGVRAQTDDLVNKGHATKNSKIEGVARFGPRQGDPESKVTRFVLRNPSGRLMQQLQRLKTDEPTYWEGSPEQYQYVDIGDEGRLFVVQCAIEVAAP